MKHLAGLIVMSAFFFLQSQISIPWSFDFGFESVPLGNQLPEMCYFWGEGGQIEIQDVYYKDGKQALLLIKEHVSAPVIIVFEIPFIYKARTIELTGYIKNEDVRLGHTSLFMQMESRGKITLKRTNMNNISGTNDWKFYSSGNIPIPAQTDKIFVGVILTGVGKVWLDQLDVKLDGKPLKEATVIPDKVKPADLDTAFAKKTNVQITNLNDTLVKDLLLLCKVWGFVKYYHPTIREGKFNIDNELFRFLPGYVKANHRDRKDTLFNWLKRFPLIESKGKSLKISRNSFIVPSYQWINDTIRFKKEVVEILTAILKAKRTTSSYLFSFDDQGRVIFSHERSYEQGKLTDHGYVLLTLFRLHAFLTYFYPYTGLMQITPDEIVLTYLPYLLEAKDEDTIKYYLLEISALMKDSQVELYDRKNFYQNFWGKNQANYYVEMIDQLPVISGYIDPNKVERDGLRVGDIIRDVNGELPRQLYTLYQKYISASNESYFAKRLAAQLLKTNNARINVSATREDKILSRTLLCYPISSLYYQRTINSDIPAWRFVTPEIGYVDLTLLKPADVPVAMKDLFLSTGLILDARNLESDILIQSLLPYFSSSSVLYSKELRNDVKFPGHFQVEVRNFTQRSKHTYNKKVVIIVNEMTRGGGERLVMALRACSNVSIIGKSSAGSPSLISFLPLPGGIRLYFSSVGYLFPDGQMAHGSGIQLDEQLSPSIQGLLDRRDELLERAAKLINKN
ncbi:MAG: S41 family peptidase [Bacteroidales bacterium]|nr:S41 family peptidase [Bacteroidales bacterium]